jgi:hypothetical protein
VSLTQLIKLVIVEFNKGLQIENDRSHLCRPVQLNRSQRSNL